jgi:hypothetical protein
MADGEVKIIFRTEAELQGAQQLEQSLERQIGAAKAAGKPFADLEEQHKRVSGSIAQNAQAAKGQEEAYKTVGQATEKAGNAQKSLHEALRGVNLQFPILGRVIGAVMSPMGAIAGAVAFAVAWFNQLISVGDRAAKEFNVADKLTAQATGSKAASELFGDAADEFAAGMNRIRTEAEPVAQAVQKVLDSLKALQQLQLEAVDKDLAAKFAVIGEDEAAGRIKPSEGIKRRKAAADVSLKRRKALEKEQADQQRAVIADGIKQAAEAEAAALKTIQPPEVMAAGRTSANEKKGFAADVKKQFEAKRPALEQELFDLQTEAADLQIGSTGSYWGDVFEAGNGDLENPELLAYLKTRNDERKVAIQEELAIGSAGVDQSEATSRKAEAQQAKLEKEQADARTRAESAAKTGRDLEEKLRLDEEQRSATAPIRADITKSEEVTHDSTYRAALERAQRAEAEAEERAEQERIREANRLEAIRLRNEYQKFKGGGGEPSPDVSDATDGIRKSAENLAQLPAATQALALATNEAVDGLWQAVADIRGRLRDGLS